MQPAGMICDVLVGLDGKTTTALVAAGQPNPAPATCRGLIDTGADITCVAAAVLRRLSLPTPTVQTTTQTTTGTAPVHLYEVSVNVLDVNAPQRPSLVMPDLLVMEMPTVLPGLDVLLGLDVLRTTRLVLDGPGGDFSLEF